VDHVGVDVRCGVNVDADLLAEGNFDAIVIATGSRPVVPYGLDPAQLTAFTDVDLLNGTVPDLSGRTVTVFDALGHRRGAATAVRLALEMRTTVRLATPYLEPMATLENPNKPPLLRQLAACGIEVLTSRDLDVESGAPRLVHRWSDDVVILGADEVLVSVGWTEVDSDLAEQLRVRLPDVPVHVIGDAVAPRLLRNAISEGAKTGARV